MYKYLFVFLTLLSFTAMGQDTNWKQSIPNNKVWSSEIQKNREPNYSALKGVQLIHTENSLSISDFSGGLFKQYSDSTALPVEIQFSGNTIVPVTIETPYGPCKISGDWNATTGQLTIKWKIDFNRIDEVTILTLSEN